MFLYTNMGNLCFKHAKLRKINSFLHLLKIAILHLSLFDRKATIFETINNEVLDIKCSFTS